MIQQEFTIKPLITCNSDHVTYMLACPCWLQYMGRTTCKLSVTINEHLANIKKLFLAVVFPNTFGYIIIVIPYYWRFMGLTKFPNIREVHIWWEQLPKMKPGGCINWEVCSHWVWILNWTSIAFWPMTNPFFKPHYYQDQFIHHSVYLYSHFPSPFLSCSY